MYRHNSQQAPSIGACSAPRSSRTALRCVHRGCVPWYCGALQLSERLAQLPIPELPRLAPIATEAIPHAPIAQAPAGDGHQARQSGAAQAAAPAIVENAMEAVALSFELLRLLLAEPLLVHCLLDVQRALRSQGTGA